MEILNRLFLIRYKSNNHAKYIHWISLPLVLPLPSLFDRYLTESPSSPRLDAQITENQSTGFGFLFDWNPGRSFHERIRLPGSPVSALDSLPYPLPCIPSFPWFPSLDLFQRFVRFVGFVVPSFRHIMMGNTLPPRHRTLWMPVSTSVARRWKTSWNSPVPSMVTTSRACRYFSMTGRVLVSCSSRRPTIRVVLES